MKGTPYGHWTAVKRTILVSAAAAAILGVMAGSGGAQSASKTTLVSEQGFGVQSNGASMSASASSDGRYVAFTSDADNLAPGDANELPDVFVRDRQNDTVERVSVNSSEFEGMNGLEGSGFPSISGDGRYVVFESDHDNLVPGDINEETDVFVRDRTAGTTQRVSVNSSEFEGLGASLSPSISSDGRYVAFQSDSDNLATGDANGKTDIFVRDRTAGTTQLVSLDSSEFQGTGESTFPSISSDGRYVAFVSLSDNLAAGDANGKDDVFVRDRTAGTTQLVSLDSSEFQGTGEVASPAISGDGRYVAFVSGSETLAPGDANGKDDIFVRDRTAGTTQMASVNSSEIQGLDGSIEPSISGDGRFVAFESKSDNLVVGDANGKNDVFVRDRTAGTTLRASVEGSGIEGNGESHAPSISSNGYSVAFESTSDNLVPGDINGAADIFSRSLGTPPPGGGGTTGAPTITSVAPAEGVSARPLTQTVRAVFNEPMDPNTINTSSVVVSKQVKSSIGAISWTPVSGTVTYNATSKLATFTPTGGLSPASKYKANVNVKAKDAGGTPLDVNPTLAGSQGKVWYFSTVK